MRFEFDETKDRKKFAWFPTRITERKDRLGSIWIWLEPYTQRVIRRYGIGGVTYYRKADGVEGETTGFVG